MKSIKLTTESLFEGDVSELQNDLDKIIKSHPGKYNFINTEAALLQIVHGSLDFFDKLDSHFLGNGNPSGIPSMEADYFVNNFYRLSNALDYLGDLYDISLCHPKGWELLKDIRTLLVHSGEQITNIKSIELANYKDAQLGRILSKGSSAFSDDNFDYRIQIWVDKHDTSKNRPENEVDYDNRKQNFIDIDIFLNAADVRNIILIQIKKFIAKVNGNPKKNKLSKKLPKAVKKQVVNDLDFDRLEILIRNRYRGGYVIENGKKIWYGFGLKNLHCYASRTFSTSNEVKEVLIKTISKRVEEFWDAYNDESIDDDDLPSLDVFKVFREYTPEFEQKEYLGRKFHYIAPTFNQKDGVASPDIDYLLRFICAVNEVLGVELNLENDVNGVICDYFVKSVEMKLR